MKLMIADTGVANLASVRFAFARLGVEALVSADPQVLAQADRLILPGVGAASAGMKALQDNGLNELLIGFQRPLLGICLGMQLLFTHSAEANTSCLGRLSGQVFALPSSAGPVPHMGWNSLQISKDDPFLAGVETGSYVYFVHSFAAAISSYTLASSCYGRGFSAVVSQDNVYACQFHPERSGATGSRILQNFLEVKP